MDETLTEEQLWGESAEQKQPAEDFCPYGKIRCNAWDGKQGCLAKSCVQRITEAQTGMAVFIEGE